VKFDDTY